MAIAARPYAQSSLLLVTKSDREGICAGVATKAAPLLEEITMERSSVGRRWLDLVSLVAMGAGVMLGCSPAATTTVDPIRKVSSRLATENGLAENGLAENGLAENGLAEN